MGQKNVIVIHYRLFKNAVIFFPQHEVKFWRGDCKKETLIPFTLTSRGSWKKALLQFQAFVFPFKASSGAGRGDREPVLISAPADCSVE